MGESEPVHFSHPFANLLEDSLHLPLAPLPSPQCQPEEVVLAVLKYLHQQFSLPLFLFSLEVSHFLERNHIFVGHRLQGNNFRNHLRRQSFLVSLRKEALHCDQVLGVERLRLEYFSEPSLSHFLDQAVFGLERFRN